jgi:hypothetical protein
LGRASVGARLAALACVLVALLFTAFAWALAHFASEQLADEAHARIADKEQSIRAMVEMFDKALSAEANRAMSLFASFLPADFSLDPARTVDIGGVAAPVLSAGGQPLDLDYAIPDQFLQKSGAIATIFARDGDDFVRITTSLKKQDGTRAVGTRLDRAGPAYGPLVAGRSYGPRQAVRPAVHHAIQAGHGRDRPRDRRTVRRPRRRRGAAGRRERHPRVEDRRQRLLLRRRCVAGRDARHAGRPSRRGRAARRRHARTVRADARRRPGPVRARRSTRPRTTRSPPRNSCRSRRSRNGNGWSAASRSTTSCWPACARCAIAS